MKAIEKLTVVVAFVASLALPFVPMGWKAMAPGYALATTAILDSTDSPGMLCIAFGFAVVVASIAFAFTSRWGIVAVLGLLGLCIFGATAVVQVSYFKNPIGSGLVLLLTILVLHSACAAIWYVRARQRVKCEA